MTSATCLFDTHCHLIDRAFPEPSAVVTRAREAGVSLMLTVGLDRDNCRRTVEFARLASGVYAGIGIHPHEAGRFSAEDIAFLRRLAKEEKVKAIGETGLDFFRNYAQPDSQRKVFHAQIELAEELNLPLILHIRDAYDEALAILEEHKYFCGVMHCYSGDRGFALKAVELGFYISFSGAITYRGTRLADVARSLPRERILVETDAPYLTPMPYRGKMKNEPALVRFTLSTVARAQGATDAEMAQITTENGKRLFRIR